MMHINISKTSHRSIITTAITIIIFIIISGNADIGQTIDQIKNADPLIISLTLIISVCTNILFSSYIWKEILKQLNIHIPYKESVIITAASMPALNILPLKLGHFIKSMYLKKYRNIPIKTSAISVILHQVIGLANILLIIAVTSLLLIPAEYQVISILLIGLIAIAIKMTAIKSYLIKIITRSAHLKRIYIQLSDASQSISKASKYRHIIKISLYSLLNKLLIITNYYLLFISLGINIPIIEYIQIISIIIILSHLPLTISGFGARESLIILFFSNFASFETLLGAGLLISIIDYILPALIGTFFIADRLYTANKKA